jgi:hypothetical protein
MGTGLPTVIQEAKGSAGNERQRKFSTHEVFSPKFRRKVIYGKIKTDIGIMNDKKAVRLQKRRNN